MTSRLRLDAFSERFRASPGYIVRPFAELDSAERGSVRELEERGTFHAVLKPRGDDRVSTLKAIDRHTAQLLADLATARRLSAGPDGSRLAEIASLVLDGVLEVETAGGFVSGPAAHRALFVDTGSAPSNGWTAQLSQAALRYAATIALEDRRLLAGRLYSYNLVPMQRSASDLDRAVEDGSILTRRMSPLLRQRYKVRTVGGWTSWRMADHSSDGLIFKLYVSAHPDHHLEVLRTAIEAFAQSEVPAFKLGRGHLGVVRPDKIVAYFTDRSHLERLADRLHAGLSSFRSQGVPFTAELSSDGIMSWGVDPPLDAGLLPWRGLESWRLSICNQLATCLVTARAHGLRRGEAIGFATDRLRLDGVDPATWTPTDDGSAAV